MSYLRIGALLAFAVAVVTVAIAANLSTGPLAQGGFFYHFLAFSGLGLLARIAILWARSALLFFILAGLGCMIELSQEVVGGAHAAEWRDLLANSLGLLFGLLAGKAVFAAIELLKVIKRS